MKSYVLYQVENGKILCETSSLWSWSRNKSIALNKKEGPIIDAIVRECKWLIGSRLGQNIMIEVDYTFEERGVISTRIMMLVDEVTVNFNEYDVEVIKSKLQESIVELGSNLSELGACKKPEEMALVKSVTGVSNNQISFRNDSAFRMAQDVRRSGVLKDGIELYTDKGRVIDIAPIADKEITTTSDEEISIFAMICQITGDYTSKINEVEHSQGGKILKKAFNLRIFRGHKKILCYAMGNDDVVHIIVKPSNNLSAGHEKLVGYELVKIINVLDGYLFSINQVAHCN